jgi:hypothetical protein
MTPSGVVGAKTLEARIVHVEEDLENTPQPPTWRAKYRGFVSQEHGYQKKDRRGVELWVEAG